eukprot:259543-Prorocentrum_minimum.AAC.2
MLDTEALEWSVPTAEGAMPQGRAGQAAAAMAGCWYLVGGGDNKQVRVGEGGDIMGATSGGGHGGMLVAGGRLPPQYVLDYRLHARIINPPVTALRDDGLLELRPLTWLASDCTADCTTDCTTDCEQRRYQ